MSPLKAPGPGRDFTGCPKFCGAVIAITAAYATAWWLTLRAYGKRTKK